MKKSKQDTFHRNEIRGGKNKGEKKETLGMTEMHVTRNTGLYGATKNEDNLFPGIEYG